MQSNFLKVDATKGEDKTLGPRRFSHPEFEGWSNFRVQTLNAEVGPDQAKDPDFHSDPPFAFTTVHVLGMSGYPRPLSNGWVTQRVAEKLFFSTQIKSVHDAKLHFLLSWRLCCALVGFSLSRNANATGVLRSGNGTVVQQSTCRKSKAIANGFATVPATTIYIQYCTVIACWSLA